MQTDINNATQSTVITNLSQGITDLVVDSRDQSITRYAAQNSIELINGFESLAGDEFVAEIDPTAATANYAVSSTTSSNPISSADLNNPSICTIIKYEFYDNYNFAGVKSFDNAFDNTTAYSNSDPNVIPIASSQRTWNFPTGSMTRVLGTNTFLASTIYYDEKGRPIQNLNDNIKSGKDVATLQYHFDGRLLSTHTKHTAVGTGFNNYGILTKYLFDKVERVTGIEKKFGNNASKTISTYQYDDLGRVKTKHLDPGYTNNVNGNSELESLNYSFNIHNQITGINKDYALKTGAYSQWDHFFGMFLGFDDKEQLFTRPKLNGQVTGIIWNSQGDDAQRKYDYTYDNAGRLANAVFKEQKTPGNGWSNSEMDFSVGGYTGRITYDLNGNLLSMSHKGVLPALAPFNIDDLRYSYTSATLTYTNKLQSVTDQMTNTNVNGLFGDFKRGNTSNNSDYVYDANGNVVVDLNKNAKELNNQVGGNGIHYNFLDKPDEIRIAGKGTIKILYSANGEKLQRTFTPETGKATTTTYINQFVYQSSDLGGDALSYINFEEGRIRALTATNQQTSYDKLVVDGNIDLPDGRRGAFDYFIMDYQQNVRMLLSEETHIASNAATMESSRSAIEDAIFGQAGGNNEVETTRYGISNTGWTGNTTSYVSRLGNLAGHNIGPNTLQKVMAGDQVSANVLYYFDQAPGNQSSSVFSSVVNSLTLALASGPTSSLVKGSVTNISNALNLDGGLLNVVNPTSGLTPGAPLAFLNVVFFDERFKYVGYERRQVDATVGTNGKLLTITNVKAPKNGYAYVYVSNKSDGNVFFDDFVVTLMQGNIIEENHYYSFGLKIAAISSKKYSDSYDGKINNPFAFNGKEMLDDDADLNWYDYGFRNYDPQIGRFMQLDPLTDDYPELTPFQFAGNDPITNIDLDGLEKLNSVGDVAKLAASEGVKYSAMVEVKITATLKVVGKADNGHKLYKIIKITSTVVQATSTGERIVNTGVTNRVGRQVLYAANSYTSSCHCGNPNFWPIDNGSGDYSSKMPWDVQSNNEATWKDRTGTMWTSKKAQGINGPKTNDPKTKIDNLDVLMLMLTRMKSLEKAPGAKIPDNYWDFLQYAKKSSDAAMGIRDLTRNSSNKNSGPQSGSNDKKFQDIKVGDVFHPRKFPPGSNLKKTSDTTSQVWSGPAINVDTVNWHN